MKLKRSTALLAAAVAVLTLAGADPAAASANGPVEPPARSEVTPDPAASAGAGDVDPEAAAALAREHGISTTEATNRLRAQKVLGERGASLEKGLAGRSGGVYLDRDGKLVVTTLDPSGDAAVTRGGARAQRVDDTSVRLENIMRQLDRQNAKGGAGGVQGWYVDVPTNTVIVTVSAGSVDARTTAMLKVANSFGASVRVEQAPVEQAPKATAYMVGGFEFKTATGGACSVGFNTVDAYNRPVVLTAGHCTNTAGTISRNGYIVGKTRTANFPADDFGTFWNSYPSYWQPSVSVYKYNGTYVNVRGQWNAPPVGATVCKSGRTTGYTCGTITALNQTVVYGGTQTVYGMVRHNACVERGDSGGSNISAGAYALGMTSGASMTSTGLCLSKVGGANVSWYQPIGEALTRNGLRLVYQP